MPCRTIPEWDVAPLVSSATRVHSCHSGRGPATRAGALALAGGGSWEPHGSVALAVAPTPGGVCGDEASSLPSVSSGECVVRRVPVPALGHRRVGVIQARHPGCEAVLHDDGGDPRSRVHPEPATRPLRTRRSRPTEGDRRGSVRRAAQSGLNSTEPPQVAERASRSANATERPVRSNSGQSRQSVASWRIERPAAPITCHVPFHPRLRSSVDRATVS